MEYRVSFRRTYKNHQTGFSSPVLTLEEASAALRTPRSPEVLVGLGRAPNPGCSIFEPVLLTPNPGLDLGQTTQVGCVVDGVQLVLFYMGICFVELASIPKQNRQ